jgi:hypothetical protein
MIRSRFQHFNASSSLWWRRYIPVAAAEAALSFLSLSLLYGFSLSLVCARKHGLEGNYWSQLGKLRLSVVAKGEGGELW